VTDSFRAVAGRKVISRASAQELGTVGHLLVDAQERRVTAVIIGRGKKARLADWSALSGFGPDAVMVGDDSALRPAADDREGAAADGRLEIVGRRALTEHGNDLGIVEDVLFDPRSGALDSLRVGDRDVPASALLGAGSYAAVFDADQESPAS